MTADTGDQYVERTTLGDGWEYSVIERMHGDRSVYFFSLSAPYSNEYCTRHNFLGAAYILIRNRMKARRRRRTLRFHFGNRSASKLDIPIPIKWGTRPHPDYASGYAHAAKGLTLTGGAVGGFSIPSLLIVGARLLPS